MSAACNTAAVVDRAESLGFQPAAVSGGAFSLLCLRRAARETVVGPRLHIYIEGDGRPWLEGRLVARDPTPRASILPELMESDDAEVVYLGRPCYFGHNQDRECSPSLWTQARYGSQVVEALAAAVQSVAEKAGARQVTLIGYSGGGVLAVLLASRLAEVVAVVTIAAPLDTDGWTAYLRVSPLSNSLNPAREPPLLKPQLHIVGGEDTVVPAWLVGRYAKQQPLAEVRLVAGAAHASGWALAWPAALAWIEGQEANSG